LDFYYRGAIEDISASAASRYDYAPRLTKMRQSLSNPAVQAYCDKKFAKLEEIADFHSMALQVEQEEAKARAQLRRPDAE
jgi:hypothetical protein